MNTVKIAFFGAPAFAADVLQQILNDKNLPVQVEFVVTQPDRKAGRDQTLTPTPVKLLAQSNSITVFDDIRDSDIVSLRFKEVDLVLLYAFGELIPAEMLKIPRWGFWNIHPSLLPLYRGPSPITYPLLFGDKTTGTSLIEMDERMDHGKIIAQEEYSILPEDTQELLKKRLSSIGYKLFKESIQQLINGTIQRKDQDHTKATYTRLLSKKDGYIPFPVVTKIIKDESISKEEISPIVLEYYKKYSPFPQAFNFQLSAFNMFRAFSPWPGLWTMIPMNGAEKRLKITGMKLASNERPVVTHVQLEGKKEVEISTFTAAYPVFA